MGVVVEVTDPGGTRVERVEQDPFWIGGGANCAVQLELPGCHVRTVEVRREPDGGLAIRAESGLPFPVRCVTGNVGTRFQRLVEGDVLNVGPAMVRLREADDRLAELDLSTVAAVPGAPVGSWYETFMEVADHLEGLADRRHMIDAAMDAVLAATSADRVHIAMDPHAGIDGQTAFFRARGGDAAPFTVSSSLIGQVLAGGKVVHVPSSAADPVASRFVSVRREGISSSIALPLSALGRRFGVFYADCVRDGSVLSGEDLHRVAFLSRLLASAIGNQTLVASLVRRSSRDSERHPALVTDAPGCTDMVERVELYVPTDYTVLLRGETGVGKEVIARAIHDLSRRAAGPFVPVNCAAIPEQLMESVLFGHEKGAFTGAESRRTGHFQEANGGTLFLDEIGDMAIDLQAKILRALQDREVTPVGASRAIKIDVRIIAATHQDLERMVTERTFREDLYYRLRELEVRIPPLRERTEDLPMLCERFLTEAASELGLDQPPQLAAGTIEHLRRRPWRGNIRELRHAVKGAALRAGGGPIRPVHLDAGPPGADLASPPSRAPSVAARSDQVATVAVAAAPLVDDGSTWKLRLEAQERSALEKTLREAGGNLTRAARLFGVPRTTYREKLVRHGLLENDA